MRQQNFEFPVKWGIDLQSEHERYLTEKYAKKPVIVMNYPKDIKALYMRVNDDVWPHRSPLPNPPPQAGEGGVGGRLAPGIGEIIGGSQREERLDVLDRSMAERGIDREHYAPPFPPPLAPARGGGLGWGHLRRYGTVPHAGFGPASSAPSPTSPAPPTSATPSLSRALPGMQDIDAYDFDAGLATDRQDKDLAGPCGAISRT